MTLLTLHIICIIGTLLIVLYTDEQALMWMLGKKQVLNKRRVTFLHHAVATGLALLLITGGLLYTQSAPSYISNPIFIIKMVAIAALIANTYFIEKLSPIATTLPFKSIASNQRMPLFISGAVSFAGWVTAALAGLFLG